MTKEKTQPEQGGKGSGNTLSEMARKVLLTGIGAIFMTEESIRNAIADMKLPKEAMGYVLDQAKKQKNELVAVVAEEVSQFFSKIKVHEEIQKALSTLQLHIDAHLSFSPKGKPISKNIKVEIEENTDKSPV